MCADVFKAQGKMYKSYISFMHTLQDVLYSFEIVYDDNKYRHIVTKYACTTLDTV